jgi:hypothetical protein
MLNNLTRKVVFASVLGLSSLMMVSQTALANNKDSFRVTNRSSRTITRLDISESSSEVWMPVEGLRRLGSGYYSQIAFKNPSPYVCLYDIRATFSNGQVVEDYQINVCANDYVFYDR